MGDVHDVAALGPLREWIPPGYDLYVFGFQVSFRLLSCALDTDGRPHARTHRTATHHVNTPHALQTHT